MADDSESPKIPSDATSKSNNELYQTNGYPLTPKQTGSVDALYSEMDDQSVKGNSCAYHVKRIVEAARLEVVAFLFTFAYIMTTVSSTTMILDKVCLVHFGFDDEICKNLKNYTANKTAVEKVANNYDLGHTLIQTAPGAVLACFIGSWSDKYGRKFPAQLALFGLLLDNIGSIICAYYLESRAEYFFIPALFSGMLGGRVTLLAMIYSYASDTTAFNKRTVKYAFIEMAIGIATPLGSMAGGWIYKFFGYPSVFFVATVVMTISNLWVAFILPETRGIGNTDSWAIKIRNLYSCDFFKESFSATFKERSHHGKMQVLLLILSMCFIVITTEATGTINYLFVYHQFNWSNTKFSTITAIYAVLGLGLLVIILPLFKHFKVGDAFLGLVGTASSLLKNFGKAFSSEPFIYHAANVLGLMLTCAPLAGRSRISKIVSRDDLAKVFSFVAMAESVLPVLATAVLSQIYNASVHTFPGLPFLVLAIFLMIPLSVFIWLTCLPAVKYEDILGENGTIKAENDPKIED